MNNQTKSLEHNIHNTRRQTPRACCSTLLKHPNKWIEALKCTSAIALLIQTVIFLLMTTIVTEAQVYPYWDAAQPGERAGSVGMPLVASSNAVFAIHWLDQGGAICRWTECGGWEDLPGLVIKNILWSGAHAPRMMTVHDHYLYAVGFFMLDGFTSPVDYSDLAPGPGTDPYTNTVQIARFDFETGLWTALGQSFSARDVSFPTTVAVDTNNNIYVGFVTERVLSGDQGANQFVIDMLDVSTNGGTSWQQVGGGLKTYPGRVDLPDTHLNAGISALHADGTNIFIGGDFTGSATITSSNIISWDGTAWHAMGNGVTPTLQGQGWLDYDWYVDTVNDIATIGTNVYVAGSFTVPHRALARFSTVTYASLPTGDPADMLQWTSPNLDNVGGLSLAVNNENLYLAGGDDNTEVHIARLSDPTAANPAGWTTNLSSSGGDTLMPNYSNWYSALASSPEGNAVYAIAAFTGHDSFGKYSDGFSRLVTGPDWSPTANITSITGTFDGVHYIYTLTITGTPGSHWQIIVDQSIAHEITLWTGTTNIVYVENSPTVYTLQDECIQSDTVSVFSLVNVQFGDPGYGGVMTGTAATGVDAGDYWNFLSPDDKEFQSDPLKDYAQNTTSVKISTSGADQSDASGPTTSLENGWTMSGGGNDFQVSANLPSGTYDLYVYNYQPYSTTFTLSVDGLAIDSQSVSSGNVLFSDVTLTSPGTVSVNCSSLIQPFCNGLQIQKTAP